MSTESPSRSSIPTFADLIERIASRRDLAVRRRQDLTSAVRRYCRLQHRQPAELTADPTIVRRELGQMSPGGTGLSPASFRNLKSLVAQALLSAGVTSVPRRSRTPLSPAWRALLEAVEDRHQRYSLSHLARYMSARGMDPAEIDDDAVDNYRQELITKSLLERPKQAGRNAVLAWNHASGTAAGGHLGQLRIPDSRPRFALPPEAFASGFHQELDAYLEGLKADDQGDDLFGERAQRPVSPDTIKSRRKQILVIASALAEAGRDPQSIQSLADLVQPEAAKVALKLIWKRLGERKTGYLDNLALLIVNLGRHWAKLPSQELDRLRALRRALNPGKGGMTEGNRRKLLQFADPANVRRLLRLPGHLMEEAIRRDRGGLQEAVLAQTAVAIAIELAAPLRIRTLVGLDLERHIVRSRPGPAAVVHLVIPAGLVKNRVPLEFELSTRVVVLIELYWERFRPRLVTQPGSLLFPGRNGPKDRGGMSKQISKTIRNSTGLRMHTHLFRHLCGFLFLKRYPGEIETVRLLLGHHSRETTERFYSAMDQAVAFRRYDEIISEYLAEEGRDAAE